MRELTQSRLKELVHYNPDTGAFVNRKSAKVLGRVTKDTGYVMFRLSGVQHYAHRLAVFYMTGAWPSEDTDHANGVRHDNRWLNIKAKSYSENQQNRGGPQKNNKLGLLGVRRFGSRFMAQIRVNREYHYLGLHPTPELAHAAYMEAKARLHTNSPRLLGQVS